MLGIVGIDETLRLKMFSGVPLLEIFAATWKFDLGNAICRIDLELMPRIVGLDSEL